MFPSLIRPLPAILASAVLLSNAYANWPEFRGPNQDGHAPESAKLPTEWSEEKNVTWKTEIHGKGWCTPVIWGDQIWLTTATKDEEEIREKGVRQSVLCVDKNTGKILFDKELFYYPEPRPLSNTRNTYASPSSVIEEGRVYVHFGSYGTVCIDTKSFETLWVRDDLPCHHWRGPASSPVLYDDLIILTFDGADYQYTAALNKMTGETVWKQDRSTNFNDLNEEGVPDREGDWRKAYNTPIFVELGGKTQMISPGAKAVWSYDPKTGEELWSLHWEEHSTASRTVYSKELNHFFFNTGYGKAKVLAVKMDPHYSGEIDPANISWTMTQRTPNRCSPVLVGDKLYVVADGGVASCIDAKTGVALWTERGGETFSGSLLYGSGNVYFFDEMGNCLIVKAGEEYDVVAENHLNTGMFASPAVDGNALILRTTTHLYRIEE